MAQTDALAKLFLDNDPETLRLVTDQLKASGEDIVPNLQVLARAGNPQVAEKALSILEEIHREHVEGARHGRAGSEPLRYRPRLAGASCQPGPARP